MMDIFRDYLERSSVHGFSYISTEKSWIAKLLWSVVVICGFCLAGTMIGQSYFNWNKSPISSTLTTHPISELQLPAITVCPPEGSNTALNVDLMRVNESFTEEKKNRLYADAKQMFVRRYQNKYQENLFDLTEKNNLEQIYEGYQSVPKDDGSGTIEIKLSASMGSISNNGLKDKYIHYILEFPPNRAKKSSVMVFLKRPFELSTHIKYREGDQYQYHPVALPWVEAEELCVSSGGHLASLHSKQEQEKVQKLIKKGVTAVWIGGHDQGGRDWVWADNSSWDFSNWSPGEPSGQNECVWLDPQDPALTWADTDCGARLPPVCVVDKVKLTESRTITINQGINTFHIWIHPQNITSPISFSWKISDSEGHEHDLPKYLYDPSTQWFTVVVDMVWQAKQKNISDSDLASTAYAYQNAYIAGQIMTSTTCTTQKMRWTYFAKVMEYLDLDATVAQLARNGGNLSEYRHNLTTEDMWFSFINLYSMMIFCPPDNSLELFIFYSKLAKEENPRTVIQATVNTLNSPLVTKSDIHKNHVEELYRQLDIMFEFQSGEAVLGLSTETDIRNMMGNNLTALKKQRESFNRCLKMSRCHPG